MRVSASVGADEFSSVSGIPWIFNWILALDDIENFCSVHGSNRDRRWKSVLTQQLEIKFALRDYTTKICQMLNNSTDSLIRICTQINDVQLQFVGLNGEYAVVTMGLYRHTCLLQHTFTHFTILTLCFVYFCLLETANNLVEVYINAQGTPSTRCPSSCHHQSRENIPWHQIRGNCSHESSLMVNSAKKHSPGLRR